MNRHNRYLAALLAVQLAILVVVFWPDESAAGGQQLFADLDAEHIVELTVSDAGGLKIRMVREGASWVLPEMDDYPVEEDRVASLLSKIVDLNTDRLVTRTRESHRQLEVADDNYQRLIEFRLEDGTNHRLFLGSSPRFQVLHVRADGHDEVYLALGISVSDAGTGFANWSDTTYFTVPQDQIIAMTLENRNGRFEFEKDDGGNWKMVNLPVGEKLLENNVASLATRVSTLRMLRPLGREEKASYRFSEPNATLIIQTRGDDGNVKTHMIRVAAQPEGETGYVVKSASSAYYVLVAGTAVRDWIDKTMEDFIELPPTPAPESEVTPTP